MLLFSRAQTRLRHIQLWCLPGSIEVQGCLLPLLRVLGGAAAGDFSAHFPEGEDASHLLPGTMPVCQSSAALLGLEVAGISPC